MSAEDCDCASYDAGVESAKALLATGFSGHDLIRNLSVNTPAFLSGQDRRDFQRGYVKLAFHEGVEGAVAL